MAKVLEEDDHKDEAACYKAKSNIYDIFKALYEAAEKQSGGDEKEQRRRFLANAERIPENWKRSLAEAVKYQDARMQMIEESKLSAAEEIMKQYQTLE